MAKQVMESNQSKKPIFKKAWFWVVIALIFFYALGSSSDTTAPATAATSPDTETSTQVDKSTETNATVIPKEEPVISEPVKEVYVNTAESAELFTGQFLVGTDIKAGRYLITTSGGSGNLFVYDKNGIPVVNEILADSSDANFGLGVTKIEVDLFDEQSIEISGLNNVSFEPAQIELKTILSSGSYLVGRDVPEGSYIATAPSGSGNFFVYTKNGIPSVNEILGKDDFGMAVEKIKFSVKNGETINLSGLEEVNLQ